MKQEQVQKQKEPLQDQREAREVQISFPLLISSLLFALDLVLIQNLVQDTSLTGWRAAALTLFVLALPCLAANAMIMYWMRSIKAVIPEKARLFLSFQLAGYITSIAEVWASIMGVSRWIGLIFAGVAAFALCMHYVCFGLPRLEHQTVSRCNLFFAMH